MKPGLWLFPTAIVVFIIFLGGYLVGTPAVDPGDVEPQDMVDAHFTLYDAAAKPFWTTQADLARQHNLTGPGVGRGTVTLPADPEDPFGRLLIGARLNDTYRRDIDTGTPDEDRTLAPLRLPIRIELDGDDVLSHDQGEFYNVTTFLAGRPLPTANESVPCDGGALWQCRFIAYDAAADTLTLERAAAPPQTRNALAFRLFLFANTGANLVSIADFSTWPVQILPDADPAFLQLAVQPPVHETFVLLGDALGDWREGTYRVNAVDNGTIQVDYTPYIAPLLDRIGQPVVAEITVVHVHEDA